MIPGKTWRGRGGVTVYQLSPIMAPSKQTGSTSFPIVVKATTPAVGRSIQLNQFFRCRNARVCTDIARYVEAELRGTWARRDG